jgi:hypothetical protein
MRILLAILTLTLVTQFANAREYKDMSSYKRLTGNNELNKRDWLVKHRKNNTREWLESCAFNFSYETGYLEYVNSEQRRDFYLWLHSRLKEKGHEVYWAAMAAEISDQVGKVYNKNNKIGQFARTGSKAVFDSTFSTLQRFYQQEEILKGEDAALWDKAMIQFEQEQLVQPIYNRMDPKTLEKLNNMVHRKGLYALMVEEKLKFTGDLLLLQDRIQYSENVLLAYVKGTPVQVYKPTTEDEDLTAHKEQIGERREAEMDRNLLREYKEQQKEAAEDRREEERRIARWNRRERKLNVKAIERSSIDPKAY